MHLDQAACIVSLLCLHFAVNDFGGQSMALEWPIWRNWQCPSSRTNSYNSYPLCSRISLYHRVLVCTAPRLAGRAPKLSYPPPSACSSMTATHRSETLNRCSRQRKCCERVGGCWESVVWDYIPRSPNWWNCSSCWSSGYIAQTTPHVILYRILTNIVLLKNVTKRWKLLIPMQLRAMAQWWSYLTQHRLHTEQWCILGSLYTWHFTQNRHREAALLMNVWELRYPGVDTFPNSALCLISYLLRYSPGFPCFIMSFGS